MAIYYGDGTQSNGDSDGGRIVQVQQSVMNGTASFYGNINNDFTSITSLETSITAHDSNNKILINVQSFGFMNGRYFGYRITRDNTNIVLGNTGGGTRLSGMVYSNSDISYAAYTISPTSFQFLDSPGDTNSHTYKMKFNNCNTGNQIITINKLNQSGTSPWNLRTASTMTLMEIAFS